MSYPISTSFLLIISGAENTPAPYFQGFASVRSLLESRLFKSGWDDLAVNSTAGQMDVYKTVVYSTGVVRTVRVSSYIRDSKTGNVQKSDFDDEI